MSYVKLRDDFPEHRKVVALSDAAFRLWVTSLCYANRNLTDGAIPRAALARLGGSTKSAAELIAASMWDETPAGYAVHDYLGHQRSRAQVEDQKAQVKRRLQRYRNGVTDSVTDSVTNGDVTPSETLHIVTEKERKKAAAESLPASSRERAREAPPPPPLPSAPRTAAEWFEATTKRRSRNSVLDGQLRNIDAAHPPECIADIFEAASSKEEPWSYARNLFARCILEGHRPRVTAAPKSPPSEPTETPEARARREEQEASIQDFGRRQQELAALSPEERQRRASETAAKGRAYLREHGMSWEGEG